VVLPLLSKLKDSKTDCIVLTKVAWALGKIPDKRAIQPLNNLHKNSRQFSTPTMPTDVLIRVLAATGHRAEVLVKKAAA
jgi:HEAT repeat protein